MHCGNAQVMNRLFRLFGSILQWNISRSNRNCQILVLFSLSETSEWTSVFHFFKPIFDTSFRLLGPFSVNAICLCKQLTQFQIVICQSLSLLTICPNCEPTRGIIQATNEPDPLSTYFQSDGVFVVINLLTLLFNRQLNTDRHIIHGNLLISIAISQTIFLAGIEQTRNKVYNTYI